MQENYYSIKKWAKDERPREKLLAHGAETLSSSELLAILINNGTKNKSAIELAKEVLSLGKNNLQELGKLTIKELMKIKGIGEAKAITISAALEIGRRRHTSDVLDKKVVRTSKEIAAFLSSKINDNQREVFAVLFLNQSNRINHFEIISEGGITGTVADPRIILKKALEENATSIVLCHNHPSGSLKPSKADTDLTEKIKLAARFHDISIYDHIIVSDQGYYSFADAGLI